MKNNEIVGVNRVVVYSRKRVINTHMDVEAIHKSIYNENENTMVNSLK
jgi:hypothetical protein